MHVMMAVDPAWQCPVQTRELLQLGLHHIFKRARKPGVKNHPMKRPPQQVRSDFPLAIGEPAWAVRRRKHRCKIQMEAGINGLIPSNLRCPLRILHKNHGADCRDGPASYTFKHPVGSLDISSPIVAVNDEQPDRPGLVPPRSFPFHLRRRWRTLTGQALPLNLCGLAGFCHLSPQLARGKEGSARPSRNSNFDLIPSNVETAIPFARKKDRNRSTVWGSAKSLVCPIATIGLYKSGFLWSWPMTRSIIDVSSSILILQKSSFRGYRKRTKSSARFQLCPGLRPAMPTLLLNPSRLVVTILQDGTISA